MLGQFDVQEAGDGLQALRILDGGKPDAVILDLDLPLLSGQAVRAEIAAHAHTRDIPVIVITASAGDHAGLGVACVVQKPFDPNALVRTVRACIASGGGAFKSRS